MNDKNTIKLMCADLNWIYDDSVSTHQLPSAPQDWAFVNPKDYFDWHMEIGTSIMFCQAYTWCGYAFYPTKLGPIAPGPGQELLPSLFELSKKNNVPFWSYFGVCTDLIMSNMRNNWVVPGSREHGPYHLPQGYLAPESPWTDLLCERIKEFLSSFAVDGLFFDQFGYGNVFPGYPVQPAWFVKEPFSKIIGREMPNKASDITGEEDLKYKREVLSQQFHSILKAVKETSPKTKIAFNMPFVKAYDPLWVDSSVMNESDILIAECTSDDILNWLLEVRKPNQRIMTTIVGMHEPGFKGPKCDTDMWEKWYSKGCDFMGYAFGVPPDFRPHKSFESKIKIVREAFKKIK